MRGLNKRFWWELFEEVWGEPDRRVQEWNACQNDDLASVDSFIGEKKC